MFRYQFRGKLWGAALIIPLILPATSQSKPMDLPSTPIDLGRAEPQTGEVDGNVVEVVHRAAQESEIEPAEENTVFDVSGRLIQTLVSGDHAAGHHLVRWDGRGHNGATVGAGIYFIRLEAAGATRVTKVVQTTGS